VSIIVPDVPAWLQNGVYPARIDRQLIDAIWTEGVLNGLDVTPRAEGANFSVDVAAGRGVTAGDDQTGQGAYLSTLMGKVNVPLSVPDTQGRIDLIVLRVNDSQAGGPVGDNGTIYPVKGTPGTTPAAPALPPTAIELARVTVASTAVSITAPNIDSTKRVKAAPRTMVEKVRVLGVITVTATGSANDPNMVLTGPTGSFTLAEPRTVSFNLLANMQRATNPGLNSGRCVVDGVELANALVTVQINSTGGPGQFVGGAVGHVDLAAGTHTYRWSIRSLSGGATAQLIAGSRITVLDAGPFSGLL
jgi:hypothetical protein